MKTLYFECYSGISGDMILGALVDLGADWNRLQESLATLPVGGFRLERREVKRCGIAATKIDVIIEGDDEHDPHHDHPHSTPGTAHDHTSGKGKNHPRSTPVHRSYADIEGILAQSGLGEQVRTGAALAYRKIAEAESHVHRQPIENIHFHEVGSIDAIVDVAGAFVGLELLGVQEVWSSEVTTGFGTVKTAHGLMPVPAPATAEILTGVPIRRGETESELVTPTGAAVLCAMCRGFGPWPEGFRVERVGYGAGTREFPGQTNYLRAYLGHRQLTGGRDKPAAPAAAASKPAPTGPAPLHTQVLSLVQTEIDDMSSEVYSHLLQRLFELGCHDASLTPIQMKKNRPGVRVEVLCSPDRRDAVVACLLRETTTFGVKFREVERVCLDRHFETVQTAFGPVRMKVGLWNGEVIKATPEYEDCHQLAIESNVPLMTVMEAARRAFEKNSGKPA